MNVRTLITQLLLLSYLLLTLDRFDVIGASIVSLCSYCTLTLAEFVCPTKYWRSDLVEFWIAGIVWLLGGIWLLWKLFRRPQNHATISYSKQSAARSLLALLVFVALSAPFIAPVGPNVQGSLATTRLLAPWSKATIVESVEIDTSIGQCSFVARASKRANQYLVDRTITFSREEQSDPPQTSSHVTTGSVHFLFGTDDNGRDVLSRVVYGTRVSLTVGLIAALLSVLVGTLVGFVAGYSNRFVDSLVMRFVDFALSIPSLFLVVAIMAFLGKSTVTLIVVLSVTGWMGIARTVRTEVLRLREREFVLAAKLLNQPAYKILQLHILRNLKSLLVVAVTLQFSSAVLAEASLSFLGLGIQPPTASWGNMMGQSLNYLHTGWWLGFFPGVLLAVVLVASHYAVEGPALVPR